MQQSLSSWAADTAGARRRMISDEVTKERAMKLQGAARYLTSARRQITDIIRMSCQGDCQLN
jgi:hypothetical protein